MNAPTTISFRGPVPQDQLSCTAPSRQQTDPLDRARAMLPDIARKAYDFESAFAVAALEAALTGAGHIYDSEEAESVPIAGDQIHALLHAVDADGKRPLVVLHCKRTEIIDLDRPAARNAIEPTARAVEVQCTERVTVCVLGIHGELNGQVFAHLRLTIEGDYSS